MDDARARRDDREVAERRLPPAQERVPLAIAREFDRGVLGERAGRAVLVHLHGVIDHQLRRCKWIDALCITAEPHDRVAHRGQVDDAGHTGEILQNDARRREGDLVGGRRSRVPREQRFDVRSRHIDAVLESQQVLEQDLQRVGQARHLLPRHSGQTPDLVGAIAYVEC